MIPAGYEIPVAVFLVAGGIVSCFLGERIFRLVLAIYGFVFGALVATSIVGDGSATTSLLAALGGGLIGALVLMIAYFMGVALVGAALAVLALHVGWTYIGGEPHPGIVIGCAIFGALVALVMQRYVIVTGTAFGGAWLLLIGVMALSGQATAKAAGGTEGWLAYPLHPVTGHPWMVPAWIVLGIVGVLVQLGLTARRA